MKKLSALLLLLLAGISLVSADEPGVLGNVKKSLWTIYKSNPFSDVTGGIDAETGIESYTLTNRGGIGMSQGSFVLEFDYSPGAGQIGNLDNLVIAFSGTGEKGGLFRENFPCEVMGDCFKVQLVQGNVYLQFVDDTGNDHMIKHVVLGTNGVPANWNSFVADGVFHIKLTVDIEAQSVKLEAMKRFMSPEDTMTTILELQIPDMAQDQTILPDLEWGRILVYDRNQNMGATFTSQVTAVTMSGIGGVPADGQDAARGPQGPQLPGGF